MLVNLLRLTIERQRSPSRRVCKSPCRPLFSVSRIDARNALQRLIVSSWLFLLSLPAEVLCGAKGKRLARIWLRLYSYPTIAKNCGCLQRGLRACARRCGLSARVQGRVRLLRRQARRERLRIVRRVNAPIEQRLRQLVQKRIASRILVLVTSLTHMNHSTGFVMTASSNAVRSVDHQPNLNELPRTSRACVIDFFEAGNRSLRESEGIASESEIDRQVQEPAIRRVRSVGAANALEEGCYWLISVAVLSYLALWIFGL